MILQRIWPEWAPSWFRSRNIATFYESIGVLLDEEAQRILDGRLAAIPYAGSGPGAAKLATGARIECEPDALPYHLSDRGIPGWASEPTWSKRLHASRWRQLWADKGTHRGRMRLAQAYFLGSNGLGPLPTIHEVHQSGELGPITATWHKLTGGVPGATGTGVYTRTPIQPSNFDFDSNGANSAQPIAPPWVGATLYLPGQEVTNDGGKVYLCVDTDGGTSAAFGGPTGTGSGIVDGHVTWDYRIPWARWWTFIDMSALVIAGTWVAPATWDDVNWDEFNWDEGSGSGIVLTSQVAADIVDMHRWKGARSTHWGLGLIWEPGVFDPNATPTQDGDGWWNLPGNGEWGKLHVGGVATRPPYIMWLLDKSQP